MYKKIALAADGSSHSFRAAEHAVQLSKLSKDSAITIIYVADYDKVKTEAVEKGNVQSLDQRYIDLLSDIIHLMEESNVTYSIQILRGSPGNMIMNYINKNEFDLCVIGSRGLNALQEFVLGNVSHKVAKRVNCPVIIIK